MAKKAGKKNKIQKKLSVYYTLLAAILIAAAFTYFYLRTSSQNVSSYSLGSGILTPNASWGNVGAVEQYDGGINHTYFIGENIGNLNVSLNDTIMGPITVYKGYLFVVTAGPYKDQLIADYKKTPGSLAAINAYTGKIAWRDYFPNQIISQPVTVNNTIIVSMSNNEEIPPQNFSKYNNEIDRLYAINMANGKIIWQLNLTAPSMLTPAYSNGKLFLPTMYSYLLINESNGKVIKNVTTGLPDTMSSPLLANGTVYFGNGETSMFTSNNITGTFRFWAINMSTGNPVWVDNLTQPGGGLNDVTPSIYKGVIVTGYLNHSMYTYPVLIGLNATTGKRIWKVDETAYLKSNKIIIPSPQLISTEPLTEPTMSAITMNNGVAYSDSNYMGILFAVNATTGKVIWAFLTGQSESNPNIYKGDLFILNDYGILYVINATTGNMIKEENIGLHHLSNELTITKNNIIVPSLQGKVVTIGLGDLLNDTAG
ncbi:MAG: PQQ-binding-like beta-propeller repeat protein [Candidatus Micrarchaeia archaeon]